jgi:hypothetical protein
MRKEDAAGKETQEVEMMCTNRDAPGRKFLSKRCTRRPTGRCT